MIASAAASDEVIVVSMRISGGFGSFVRRVDASEILELAATRLSIEPLGVAGFGDRERRVHEDLDELAVLEERASHPALALERGYERGEHDESGIGHEPCDFGDPTDVLDPIGVGEAEILVEPVADVVAVQQIGVTPVGEQLALDDVGDGGFARSGQSGEPEHRGLLALERRMGALSTSCACRCTFCERRSAKRSMPAPTVSLVIRSMRMKPPVSRFS